MEPARRRVGASLHEVPLSTRLVAIVTSLLVVALLLTGVVTVALLQRVLTSQVDDDLARVVGNQQVLRAVLQSADNPSIVQNVPSDYMVHLNDASGRDVGPSPTPPNQASTSVLEPVSLARAKQLAGSPFTTDASQGGQLRAIAVPVPIEPDTTLVLTVARSLAPVDRAVSAVAAWFLVVGVLVAVTGALLGAAAVRRAFRPLREVEAVASAYGDGDTSPRVADTPATTEVGRLGRAINTMLDRIETSLAAREASEERMRRFVGDASHELRTPLAAVRGFAELHRMGALSTPKEVAGAFRRVEDEATRMGGLVDDLLLLARLDEQRPMKREPVDLLVLAADAREDAGALAPGRTVRLVGPGDGSPLRSALVTGDEPRLRQVLENLLANALRHTPAGTPVEIGAGVRDGSAVLRVVDHGPGVAPEDARKVFERFYRSDVSRVRTQGGGSGLGLAIVAAIVGAHGGAVRLVPTPGGGATAEVALPLDGEEPVDEEDLADEAVDNPDEPVDNAG